MNDKYTNDYRDVGEMIMDCYKDIGESVYKGHDHNCAVFVDMRGDFELLRISSKKEKAQTMSAEEYQAAIVEAVNDAIEEIKKERINVVGNMINAENGEF